MATDAESEPVVRDFFGRPAACKAPAHPPSAGDPVAARLPDPASKPKAWFRFYEGFSNAVRKPTPMKDLLHTVE
ncbi:hypothetical protein IWQ57_001226 [Coemansia nantahalensis]|uniref:Uncharacterized protein n=1 Tax=Coemansia nantahalensis TaxID=2789366 RepID=A0ACC1K4Q2_9FUNG|nr:hypothetical protein IWQ57_001226 [Coemansia nantahalensis]